MAPEMRDSLRAFICASLTLSAGACATAYKPDGIAVLAEGKSRHMPVFIYSVSWSSPNFGGGRMQVGIADLDEKAINGIELGVSDCGNKGEVKEPKPLFLNGPFIQGSVYATFPSMPVDYADRSLGTDDIVQIASSSGHLVIRSVTLLYADGSKQVYDKDISPFLAKTISNFCANGPGSGNLPPSATIERH